ncbi:MAG TPA: S8 family serine peptidase, partial [Rubricoccaceae bacterium]
LYTLLLGAALTGTLGACDSVTDAPDDVSAPPTAEAGKLRHWGLMPEATAQRGGDGTVDFVVTFSSLVGDPVAASQELFSAQGVIVRTYYRDSFTGVAVTADADELESILNGLVLSDSVSYVEPDVPVAPVIENVDYVTLSSLTGAYGGGEWNGGQLRPWSIKRIEANSSWAQSGNGSGTVNADVYVIDGPVAHTDLNVVERQSFLPAGMTPASALHGTHVAGIIGAMDNTTGIVGVAPGVRIHSMEVLDANGSTTLSTLLSAVEFVKARKTANPSVPMVVNMSIGMDIGTTAYNALDDAVQAAVQAGVVFVVSAGNGHANASTYSPAHAAGAITVGATDIYDAFAGTFSNFGSTVDILAPGMDVLSTADGNRFATLSGTSMAAPHVAGGAALWLSRNPSATPAAVLARMLDRGKDATAVPSGTQKRRLKAKDL